MNGDTSLRDIKQVSQFHKINTVKELTYLNGETEFVV